MSARPQLLVDENVALRASLAQLRSGLQAGQLQLSEALQTLVAASAAEQPRALQLSERHVALFAAFLRSAIAVAAS